MDGSDGMAQRNCKSSFANFWSVVEAKAGDHMSSPQPSRTRTIVGTICYLMATEKVHSVVHSPDDGASFFSYSNHCSEQCEALLKTQTKDG
jgi:hypothetical protein